MPYFKLQQSILKVLKHSENKTITLLWGEKIDPRISRIEKNIGRKLSQISRRVYTVIIGKEKHCFAGT